MAEILEGFGGTPEQASRAVALLKSLSHEGRLQILCCLVDGELSVTQICGVIPYLRTNGSMESCQLQNAKNSMPCFLY